MKIHKRIHGEFVELELVKIKDYPRYSLYQIYKIENNQRIPLYKECYTDLQIREIIQNKNIILEEMFEL